MPANWWVEEAGDEVWVRRSLGSSVTASFRVGLVGDRPLILEARVACSQDQMSDGLSSVTLRHAVAVRGVIEAIEEHQDGESLASWPPMLRALHDREQTSRHREVVLTAIGYVTAVDGGSRKPDVDVAAALGLSRRRVRINIERAQDQKLLARRDATPPVRGHRRGVPGDYGLTLSGDDAFDQLLGQRLGVRADGVHSSVDLGPGTAASLLTFLTEPGPSGPLLDSGAVVVKADGVQVLSVDAFMGGRKPAPDGGTMRVVGY